MSLPSNSLSRGAANFTVSNSDVVSTNIDNNTSATHASANSLTFSGKSVVDSGQRGEFLPQLPPVNTEPHGFAQDIPKDATSIIDRSIAASKPDSPQLLATGIPDKERLLATIRTISEIQPIENADNIEVATVDGWKVVVAKSDFQPGQPVIFCEIDSILPVRDEFEFLRKSSHTVLPDGSEGFRLRTIKLRGQLSQGLVLPLSTLGNDVPVNPGDDVTSKLGIKKYEPAGGLPEGDYIKGRFPHFIPKSNEVRIQNLQSEFDTFKDKKFYVSEKLDGTSSTFYLRNNEYGVCSKNYQLQTDTDHPLCQIASENNIESKLRGLGRNIAIQAEVIGQKIGGNPYALKDNEIYVFNIYDIDKLSYMKKDEMEKICQEIGLPTCPVVSDSKELAATVADVLVDADGKSKVNNKKNREGLVYVFDGNNPKERISFKAVSNNYLLKEKPIKKAR
ncbi:RNA ligase (ATP) [Endozoicomonas sp. YOMI1]|uniref:RNA ligase (ATP) n=1 Tax=Endozoicomonas sp. YOMI1 TaxID=2828739 RepID=UPI0021473BEE